MVGVHRGRQGRLADVSTPLDPLRPADVDPAREPLEWATIADFLRFWLEHNPLSGEERAAFDRYYRNYRRSFSPYLQHHVAGQAREVDDTIRQGASPRLLDVGAGCGTEALWFALNGANVTAIDVQAGRLATARARHAWLATRLAQQIPATFVEASLFDLDPASPFDVIWMEQTFHHLEPRQEVYGALFRLLRPGGTLVISEVSAWNLPLQLQLFLRRGFKTKKIYVDSRGRRLAYGNERITTPGALRRGLERAIVAAVPLLSTHFNLVADRPR